MRLKIKDSLHQAVDGLAKEHVAQLSRLIEGTTSFPNSTDFKDAIWDAQRSVFFSDSEPDLKHCTSTGATQAGTQRKSATGGTRHNTSRRTYVGQESTYKLIDFMRNKTYSFGDPCANGTKNVKLKDLIHDIIHLYGYKFSLGPALQHDNKTVHTTETKNAKQNFVNQTKNDTLSVMTKLLDGCCDILHDDEKMRKYYKHTTRQILLKKKSEPLDYLCNFSVSIIGEASQNIISN
jgi:hypothetical protein